MVGEIAHLMASNVVSIRTRLAWSARAHPRLETHVHGTLEYAAGEGIGCFVEDVSLGGAKICPADGLLVGDKFQLSIPQFDFIAPIRVIWTNEDFYGVAFCVERPLPRFGNGIFPNHAG